jgi:hypothetical protein
VAVGTIPSLTPRKASKEIHLQLNPGPDSSIHTQSATISTFIPALITSTLTVQLSSPLHDAVYAQNVG